MSWIRARRLTTSLWERVRTLLEGHPERLQVARTLIENGLSVRDGNVYLNEIEIADARLARAAHVDRRTIGETVQVIERDPQLGSIFRNLRSAGPSLRGVAKQLDLGVVEITAEDAHAIGILAGASRLLADAGLSVRQALVGDPDLEPDPKLTLICDRPVPGHVVQEMLRVRGIARVTVG